MVPYKREGGFFASIPYLGVSSLCYFPHFQTEQAEDEAAQTMVEIYLCVNMPHKPLVCFKIKMQPPGKGPVEELSSLQITTAAASVPICQMGF